MFQVFVAVLKHLKSSASYHLLHFFISLPLSNQLFNQTSCSELVYWLPDDVLLFKKQKHTTVQCSQKLNS